ncbi:TVP38/TMEM64 family protein [Pseudonocardia nigra]|uniref:TVP38/TMEM64 family protein n=1 Tax=Pseudonocardia nigra TaxID=1921578 RepID=UPI001C5D8EE9|nr:TVP38/TMEM64 family protein [Pseudonocardia nigra]
MKWGRIAVGVGVLVVAAIVVLLLREGIPDVRRAVQSAGIWAPMLFVLLHGAVTLAPVPRTVFTVAAGVLFGAITGVALSIAGTALAAAGAFWLGKLAGGRFVQRHAQHRAMQWVRARLDRRGLLAVISLRLIPAMPFSVMNYASALSGVRFPPYLVGTVLGVLPGTIGIVVLGDAAIGGNPHPAMFAVSLVSGAVGLTGAFIASRRPVPVAVAPEPVAIGAGQGAARPE